VVFQLGLAYLFFSLAKELLWALLLIVGVVCLMQLLTDEG